MKRSATALLLVVGVMTLQAETRLSGEIHSSTLTASGNPYIVDKDISVPAGKQLTVKEGCVFLFNGFTGLAVLGDMSVEGTTDKPVIFTSINDGDFNPKSAQLPNPFDWNGIIVTRESGSVHIQNFQLRYSVYGIKSQNTLMTIQNGVFRQNGQFHFTMDDKIQYVQDNIPYSYNISSSGEKPAAGEAAARRLPALQSAAKLARRRQSARRRQTPAEPQLRLRERPARRLFHLARRARLQRREEEDAQETGAARSACAGRSPARRRSARN